MRARTIIAMRAFPIDHTTWSLELTTSDGTSTGLRTCDGPRPTIMHAARCLARRYDLVAGPDGEWAPLASTGQVADLVDPGVALPA